MTRAARRVVLLFLISGAVSSAAAVEESTGEAFERARQLAFSGERDQARELCLEILSGRPDHWDARVLLGRLYAWDKEYGRAREELTRVVEAKPGYADARSALIDVELWSGNPDAALKLADDGLAIDRRDADFEFARARAFSHMKRYPESADAAERTLAIDPDHEPAKRLLRRVYDNILGTRATIEYEYESFDDDTDPWHLLQLEYHRAHDFGSLIYRLNLAQRFDDSGVQAEVDAYPAIRAGTYLYLNLGLSDSDLFPEFRVGAEAYQTFPRGWESSLGFRFLDFETNDVTILTGSVAKYRGNHWVQLRPYYVSEDGGDSFSGEVQYRLYFGGRYEWVGFTVGGGVDNEIDVVTLERDDLSALRLRLDLRKKIMNKLRLKAAVGYREQELSGGVTRGSWFVGLGFDRFF